jgi:hypothetical protein
MMAHSDNAFPSSLGTGALAVALSWGAVLLAWALVQVCGGSISYSAVIAIACVVVVPIVARPRRGGPAASRLRAASVALLGWFPYVLGGAVLELDNPIAVSGHTRCGNGIMGLYFLTLCSVPVVFSGAIVFAAMVARLPLRRATRGVALVATIAAVLALGASVRRIHDPDPDGYLASLPIVAELSGADPRFHGPGFEVAETALAGEGPGASCVVSMERGQMRVADRCGGLQILQDVARSLWIFRSAGAAPYETYALSTDRGGAMVSEVTVWRVASSLRPPTVWIVLNAAGALCAALLLIGAAWARARAERWRAARPGAHTGGGWVTFADAPPTHVAEAAGLPLGDVLVREASRQEPSYREHGRIEAGVQGGTLEAQVASADALATGLCAFALLLAAISAAPVLAAAARGLLG